MKQQTLKAKLLPLILVPIIFGADQVTKLLVEKFIAPYSVGASFFDGALRIIRVYNTGAAFSMGHNWAEAIRMLLLGVLPLIVLCLVLITYIKSDDFSSFQRWMIAGVIAGGLGNLYDRFFRAEGVVDFIDVKFYGIFGLDRWPTFNVADAAVCVCGFLLIVSFIKAIINEKKENNLSEEDSSENQAEVTSAE